MAEGIEGGGVTAIDPVDMLRTVKIRGGNKATYTYNLRDGTATVQYAGGSTATYEFDVNNQVELRPPPAFWERRAANRA